jgi:putative two-component system response regulator
VEGIPFLQECMPVVHYHHERWDGSGYPFGLKGEDIPIFARIFAVADVFDALTSKRNYRKRSSADDAVTYLREQANILFDPQIVEALAQLPYAEFVQAEKTVPITTPQ